jgi:hypothetical protein
LVARDLLAAAQAIVSWGGDDAVKTQVSTEAFEAPGRYMP